MSPDDRLRESTTLVEGAVAELPSLLARALDVRLPTDLPELPLVTTGIGASEGPARLLAAHVVASGRPARFIAISELAAGRHEGELLVAFSQGLSPNARLGLRSALGFERRVIVTSVGSGGADHPKRDALERLERAGVDTIVVPPASESGTLARLRGPTVATLTALRLAGRLGARGCADADLRDAPARYARLSTEGVPLAESEPIALVTSGVSVESAFGIRWKLLETLLVPDPPTWDVLAFGHGPSQATRGRPLVILTLETPSGRALGDRLVESVDPDHHRLVRLRSTSDDPIAALEHLARVDACLVATLRARPRNLFDWPSRGRECALYVLGDDAT